MSRLIHVTKPIPNNSLQARVFYDWNLGEYRVKLFDGRYWLKEADYFTDDETDAIETAEIMVVGGRS